MAGPARSEAGLICLGDEGLEGQNLDLVHVFEVIIKLAACIEVSECPSLTSQDQVGPCIGAGLESVNEAHDLKRDFLLGCATDLLPF